MKMRFLYDMPRREPAEPEKISEEIVDKIASYGIDREVILKYLTQNSHNTFTTTYYLLLKNGYTGQKLRDKELNFESLIEQSRDEFAEKLEAKIKQREQEGDPKLSLKSSEVRKKLINKMRHFKQDSVKT